MDTPPAPPYTPPPPKQGLSTGCIVGLVIGIVVLIGVGVIAILAALAVPAFNQVQTKAKVIRTKSVLKDLELGIKNYQMEYNRMPPSDAPGDPASPMGQLTQGVLLEVLLGTDKAHNPREIQFIDVPPKPATANGPGMVTTGGRPTLVDVWGNPLLVLLDDGTANLPDPEHPGSTMTATVLIWSAGPDGDFTTWKDNVANWK